jgi:3',5'-cyclic AMP phosphodiesterase CpdA
MRIAHLSDLHVLSLKGAVPFRLFNKRASGYANLLLKRKHVHRSSLVVAIAEDLRAHPVDHVVITGDVSNLALETEFTEVRRILDDVLGLPPSQVTIVPGNHDVYTRGAARSKRFFRYFERYLESDLPLLRAEHPAGMFPVVKLRGPVAIIGLSTAVARPPFVASGHLGSDQLDLVTKILASPEVLGRTPVVLMHHPVHNPSSWMKSRTEGLDDAEELIRRLSQITRGLVLHGHLHRRIRQGLNTSAGQLDAIGATSASLLHPNPSRMAGYNLYEFGDDGGITSIGARVFDPATGVFRPQSFSDVAESRWH